MTEGLLYLTGINRFTEFQLAWFGQPKRLLGILVVVFVFVGHLVFRCLLSAAKAASYRGVVSTLRSYPCFLVPEGSRCYEAASATGVGG